MQFISALASANNRETFLRYWLHKHLTYCRPGRSHAILHASDLTGEATSEFCPREFALKHLLKVEPKPEYVTTSMAVTYEIGFYLQRRVVEWLAAVNKGVTDWKCEGCGALERFTIRPHRCPHCNCRALAPEEMRFTSPISGASMGLDLAAKLGHAKLLPVEVKTIDKDEFKKLAAPLAEHKQRTNLYLRILAEAAAEGGDPRARLFRTDRAHVIYVSKGGYGCKDAQLDEWKLPDSFSPFKEYVVEYDETMTTALHEKAVAVQRFRTGKAGLPEGICPTQFCSRAKACRTIKACFSGGFPAGMMMGEG